MEIQIVSVIVVICYVVAEIYKVINKDKQDNYKYIPLVVMIVGGVLGVLIYYTDQTLLKETKSIWEALIIGMLSGISSTGANQLIKQLFKKEVWQWLKLEKEVIKKNY